MKRILSLALALTAAVSLVTIGAAGAGAANFSDGDTIRYKEAVDVVSALDIIGGYTDGSFRPDSFLSRGAASKVICNMMLGPAVAGQLNGITAAFADVPADSTFSGYIGWCVSHDIVSGYADGTFKPFDQLSGFAFLKMLLCALGYDQALEGYIGSGWSSNVQTQALQIGLDRGLGSTLDGGKPVTRDIACLFVFNALQADEVEYTGNAVSTRQSRTWGFSAPSYASNINSNVRSGENIRQFAEEHFNTLVKAPSGSTGWTLNGSPIGTSQTATVKTYHGDVSLGTIYADLGMYRSTSSVTLFLNGQKDNTATIKISSGSIVRLSEVSAAAGAILGGDAEIQAFRGGSSITIYVTSSARNEETPGGAGAGTAAATPGSTTTLTPIDPEDEAFGDAGTGTTPETPSDPTDIWGWLGPDWWWYEIDPTVPQGDPLKRLEDNPQKRELLFGDANWGRYQVYESEEEARSHMTEVSVPVWTLRNGEKRQGTMYLTVHSALAEDVKAIFTEIFNDSEQFPIESIGGFRYREGSTSEHTNGTAIDINADQNYQIRDGVIETGSYWEPGVNPYSIPTDSSVVRIFAEHGWSWGGDAWAMNADASTGYHDYMHFSYRGR